jgi:PST family polysaccharide transporter
MSTDPVTEELPLAVRRGAAWVVVGQVVSQFISVVTLICLYRLVAPEAFGLLGMALPWVMLPRTLATLGLSAAAVQRQKLSVADRSLLFWLQTAVGSIIALATYFAAAPAAWLYGVADVAPLVRALAATVLIASLSATHQALLERRLQLARVMLVRLIGQLLGAAAAIVAALRGWQAEALVVQQYGELLALLASSWIADPWLPHGPRRGHVGWRELALFSGCYSLSSLLFVMVQNVDKLLLGIWLGDTAAGRAIVGAYTQAYNLMMRPVYLVTTPLSGVLLPALSRAQSQSQLFEELTQRAFRLAATVLLPASVGLAIVAADLLPVLGGAEWREAGIVLAIFAPAIAFQGWINLCGSVLAARGRTGMLCFGAALILVIATQAVAVGYSYGKTLEPQPLAAVQGVAGALALATVLLSIPYVSYCLLAAGVRPWPVLSLAIVPLRDALLMGLAVLLVKVLLLDVGAVVSLAAQIVTGVVVYGLLARPWRALTA